MFGVIYLTYGAIMSCVSKVGCSIQDYITCAETLDTKTGLFYDTKMRCYDATMGKRQVVLETHNMGRAVTRDTRTYKILRDLTQEAMDKELAYYKAHPDINHTVVRWSTREDIPHANDNKNRNQPLGIRYKDVKTGAVYVKRCFGGRIHSPFGKKYNREEYMKREAIYPVSTFYMDINTGKLVRPEDGTYDIAKANRIKECKYTLEEIEKEISEKKEKDNKWIEIFNKEQEENIKKGMREVNGFRFYCNSEMVDW